MRWPRWTVGVLPTLLTPHANAELEYPSATISWRAPEGCPSEAEVARRIDTLLGGSLVTERAQRLAFRAVVDAHVSGQYAVHLEVSGADGTYERQLTHTNCEQLAEATSLVVALAIDPARVEHENPGAAGVTTGKTLSPTSAGSATVRGSEQAPPVPPASAAAPTTAPAASTPSPTQRNQGGMSPAPSAPAPRAANVARGVPTPNPFEAQAGVPTPNASQAQSDAPAPWGAALGAAAALGSGQLPDPSLGFGLGAGAIFERSWWVTLFAQTWLPSRVDVDGTEGGSVEFDLTTVGARGCFARSAGRIAPLMCFGAELGMLEGTGDGLSSNRTSQDRWSGLYAEAGALLSIDSWLDVAVSGALGLTLERPRFGVVDATGDEVEVFQPRAWYARVTVGPWFRFD